MLRSCRSADVRWTLLVCFGNCVIALISTCLYYSELHHLGSSPFFATELNTGLGVLMASFWLLLLKAVLHRRATPEDDGSILSLLRGGGGCWRWVLLSVFLATQNTMEIAAIQQLGNDNLPPILQQAVVPLSLVLSYVFLGARYTVLQLLGASLVVIGVTAGFLPDLLAGKGAQSGGGGSGDKGQVFWVVIFLLSRVPQALANVIGEDCLKGRPEAVWCLRATLLSNILGLPSNVGAALLLSAPLGGGPGEVLQDYSNGTACLLQQQGTVSSKCSSAWRSVLLFIIPGTLYTLSEFQVLQTASASTFFLLAALQLPLQDALLSSSFIMGSEASEFRPMFFVSVPVVALGLALFGLASRAPEHEIETEDGLAEQSTLSQPSGVE